MPVLCIGEALVDLVCERPVRDFSEARSFVPHCGGAVANAALVAARCGSEVALAGGAGEDPWARWLEERLRSEGVDLRWWSRVPGIPTPLAFVVVNERAEPSFLVYGQGIEAGVTSLSGKLEEAVESSEALLFGSNTLVGERERDLSLRAARLARAARRPLLFDVNLRVHRWADRDLAIELARQVCADALLVKLNREESRLLTGESEPARAAEAIVGLGCAEVVVTLGAEGALARGMAAADVPGVPARAVDTTGAGDVLMGVLTAALSARGFDPAAVVAALPRAVEAASRSTEGWGAVDSLPALAPLR